MNDNTMKYVCTNIQWDTDGDDMILSELPKSITVEVPVDVTLNEDELMDFLSDLLSDETGWCHYGFDYTPEVVN